MTATLRIRAVSLILLLLAGCSGGKDQPGDSGLDAADSGDDGGKDGGDRAPGPYWEWCPRADDYLGGDWKIYLQAEEQALYCGTFNEARTLEEELRVKSRMRLIPGRYPLPQENGSYPFFLPACFEFTTAGTQPLPDGTGEIIANHSPSGDGTFYRFIIRQPMRTAGGDAWVFESHLYAQLGAGAETLVANGDHPGLDETTHLGWQLCRGGCESGVERRGFDSCHFDSVTLQRHTLEFDGGRLVLEVRMGVSMASTEPAIFIRAAGTLDGVDFEQEDYYKLIYNPSHHHFTRDFAVLFDTPIGGACGLRAEELVPWPPSPQLRLATIRCDLSVIAERRVSRETFERP